MTDDSVGLRPSPDVPEGQQAALEIRCEHGVQVFADGHDCLPCTRAELAKYHAAYVEERTAKEQAARALHQVCEVIVSADADVTRNRRKRMTEAAQQAWQTAAATLARLEQSAGDAR